jgi:DNA-directed RNA polymerase I subunit RPA2
VDIFMGVVYYQRLRHMVSDKHQVRARGPINPLTRQPIHGRKVHGGIRLGEMERDSLLAHGCAFLVQDRLLHCSDECKTFVCARCGSLLSPMMLPPQGAGRSSTEAPERAAHCRACGDGKDVEVISLPYVFQYLTNELTAMNIKTRLDIVRPSGGVQV